MAKLRIRISDAELASLQDLLKASINNPGTIDLGGR
jgi:hypothetical protein